MIEPNDLQKSSAAVLVIGAAAEASAGIDRRSDDGDGHLKR
jgi:hypothetical protein